MPKRFWEEAINPACYASNRIYLHRLLKKTAYELLVGRKPNTSYFRVFGCKCYIYKKRQHLGKFQRRCDIGFSWLDTPQAPRHIGSTMSPPELLKKPMMWSLIKQMKDMGG